LRDVHLACLTHWIEVTTSTGKSQRPRCELCNYEFRRNPLINPLRLHLPHVEFSDCVLNLLFLFLLVIMILCGWVAIFYLGTPERRQFLRRVRPPPFKGPFLNEADVTVIIASILFLAALFLALFTQYRTEVTFLQLFQRCWTANRNWRIRDYRLDDDEERSGQSDSKRPIQL